MEVRLNGEIRQARCTADCNHPGWELRVFDDDGGIMATFETRQHIMDSNLQITQSTHQEYELLRQAGFMPPFRRD